MNIVKVFALIINEYLLTDENLSSLEDIIVDFLSKSDEKSSALNGFAILVLVDLSRDILPPT